MMAFFLLGTIWQGINIMKASEAKRKDLPGHAYFKKIWDLYNVHYNTGELFMEYLKKDYINKDGKLCNFCQAHDWVGVTKPGKNTSASSRSQ